MSTESYLQLGLNPGFTILKNWIEIKFLIIFNKPLKIWCRELLFVLQPLVWPFLNACYLQDVLVLNFQQKSNEMFTQNWCLHYEPLNNN